MNPKTPNSQEIPPKSLSPPLRLHPKNGAGGPGDPPEPLPTPPGRVWGGEEPPGGGGETAPPLDRSEANFDISKSRDFSPNRSGTEGEGRDRTCAPPPPPAVWGAGTGPQNGAGPTPNRAGGAGGPQNGAGSPPKMGREGLDPHPKWGWGGSKWDWRGSKWDWGASKWGWGS